MTPSTKMLSVAEARAIDEHAVRTLGLPTLLLMENAARGVAEVARPMGFPYIVLCGSGNNGGDGLAVARHLGRAARVYLMAEPDPDSVPDAALQLEVLRRAGQDVRIDEVPDPDRIGRAVWIDALFGIGLSRPIAGVASEWIDAFERAKGPKVAVDVPSGLDADRGVPLGRACHVDVTVTFAAAKRGFAEPGAREYLGRVHVASLGLPESDVD